MSESECEKLWHTKKKFQIPGFENEEITIAREKLDNILASETSKSFKLKLSNFLRGKGTTEVSNMYIQ